MAGEETLIVLPAPLKAVLEDDCFWIQRRTKLLHLPTELSVESLLREFYYTCLENTNEDINFQLLSEVLDGIKVYFDFTLADHLLYKPEKEQHKLLGILNPIFSKKATHQPDDADSANEHPACGRLPSQVYGAVHLLRLFVKLPNLLSYTQLPPTHLQLLHVHFRDLLNYLCSRKQELFQEEHYYDSTSTPLNSLNTANSLSIGNSHHTTNPPHTANVNHTEDTPFEQAHK